MEAAHLARLRDAFSHRCVAAWLGHGDVLLLGFGDEPIAPPRAGERHAVPPFELATNFAEWRVEGGANAEVLVGKSVESWELIDRLGLRIEFTGATLIIEPWPAADGRSDAWSLSAPDKQVLAVSTEGHIVVVSTDTPIRDRVPD